MQWFNDFLAWLDSYPGQRLLSGVILPFVAILLAGIIGALIGRGATRRLVAQRDHETRVAAVTALVTAGQQAAKWGSLTASGKEHAEELAARADITVRLLPLPGTELVADWAAHQVAAMRTNSVSYSFQADQTVGEYVDRLAEWLHHPRRAKKLFSADLERWRYETPSESTGVLVEQQRWADQQQLSVAETAVVK
jgi:hypothetical protein